MKTKFCDQCQNIVVPKFIEGEHVWYCKTCGSKYKRTDDLLYTEMTGVLVNKTITLKRENKYDPLCPEIIKKCNTCDKETVMKYFYDDNNKKKYLCTVCDTLFKAEQK